MNQNEKVLNDFKKIEFERLLQMVKLGQMSLMAEEGRKITGAMSAHLVNTTEDEAWAVLLNYESYCRFLPGIQTSKVLSRCGNTMTVRFEAGVKVMGVGGSVKYTYRMEVEKPYVYSVDVATGEVTGYWAVLPTPNKNQIIIMHADAAKDVSTTNMFLKFLVDKLPTAEIALSISPVAMLVNRMKHRMEQKSSVRKCN
jgi:hypothetical protein